MLSASYNTSKDINLKVYRMIFAIDVIAVVTFVLGLVAAGYKYWQTLGELNKQKQAIEDERQQHFLSSIDQKLKNTETRIGRQFVENLRSVKEDIRQNNIILNDLENKMIEVTTRFNEHEKLNGHPGLSKELNELNILIKKLSDQQRNG